MFEKALSPWSKAKMRGDEDEHCLVTVRRWNDMCTTTTDALIRGLVRRGHEITVLNADRAGSHDGFPWKHVPLQQSKWPEERLPPLQQALGHGSNNTLMRRSTSSSWIGRSPLSWGRRSQEEGANWC